MSTFLQFRALHGKRVFTRLVYVGVLFVGNCSTVNVPMLVLIFRKKEKTDLDHLDDQSVISVQKKNLASRNSELAGSNQISNNSSSD